MQKIDTIQVLRGLAATLVVSMHMLHGIEAEGFHWHLGERLFANGRIGVDIFFVISGFIIYFIAFRGDRPSIGTFVMNRFWRVVPPYWAVLVCLVLLFYLLWLVSGDASRIPTFVELLSSALLWPMVPLDYVLGVAWTLSLEILFYLVFALTALRFGSRAFFAAMIAWYIIGMLCHTNGSMAPQWALPIFNPVVLEFLWGALIAKYFLTGRTKGHRWAFALGLVAILALLWFDVDSGLWIRRELIYGIPSAVLIYGAIGIHWSWPKPLLVWGESSYLLYLIHIPFYMVVGRGLEILTGFNIYSSPLSAVATIVMAVLFAALLCLKVERPYHKMYRKLMSRN